MINFYASSLIATLNFNLKPNESVVASAYWSTDVAQSWSNYRFRDEPPLILQLVYVLIFFIKFYLNKVNINV